MIVFVFVFLEMFGLKIVNCDKMMDILMNVMFDVIEMNAGMISHHFDGPM